MSFFTDDQNIGGQLKVGRGFVPAVGESIAKINGSAQKDSKYNHKFFNDKEFSIT